MSGPSEPHPQTGQPVGLPVDAHPAQAPGPVTLQGRYGRDSEWPVRKAAFERWLAPDNFTGEGRQQQSLRGMNGASLG